MKKSLYRIVESQLSNSFNAEATDTPEESKLLNEILEESKPFVKKSSYDRLIYTPFRYELPVPSLYAARFRPPGFDFNVWYGSYEVRTAIYEASYHFLRERIHLKNKVGSVESRTLVTAKCEIKNFLDISKRKNIKKIMNRVNYSESYLVANEAIKKSKDGILYPSCRDPKKGICAAAYKIESFLGGSEGLTELTLHLYYRNKNIQWSRYPSINFTIDWLDICD